MSQVVIPTDLGTEFDTTTGPDIKINLGDGLVKTAAGEIGLEIFAVSSPAVVTSTTSTPIAKISTATSVLTGGQYLIEVSYGWSLDAQNIDFIANLFVGGIPLSAHANMHRQEPQDAGGAFGATGTNQANGFSQKFIQTLPAGASLVVLNFAPENNGVEASMWDAVVTIQKIN